MGWYTQGGGFVKPFEDALFKFNGTGLLPNPVKTDFGYHLIKVTQPKTRRKYKLATIKKQIAPGEATREEAFRKADEFAGTTSNSQEFINKVSKDATLASFTAEKLRPGDNTINALPNAREIVRWAFNEETEVGDVSQVFELNNQYVIATLTGKTDDGQVTVDNYRPELTSAVRNELKAQQIMQKLGTPTGDLQVLASNYGGQAQVNTAQDVTVSSNTLQNVGFDPEAVGRIFGLKEGQRTQPFAGANGVLIIELTDLTPAPEVADYSQYKNQVTQTVSSRSPYYINEAIKEKADIEDKRYRFY